MKKATQMKSCVAFFTFGRRMVEGGLRPVPPQFRRNLNSPAVPIQKYHYLADLNLLGAGNSAIVVLNEHLGLVLIGDKASRNSNNEKFQ